MAASNWPTIPDPAPSLPSLQACVMAIKESVELLTGQRGPVSEYSVDQRVLDIKNALTNGPTSLSARITQIFEATLDTLNTSSLASEITEITAEITDARSGQPNLRARVTQVNQARIDGDTANATSINAVQASLTTNFNSISASGQVKLVATAIPGGATAAYEWVLTAGNASCGMKAVALSGGGAAISFSATQFGLNDSGTHQNVFTYTGGVFRFNAPVSIGTANIDNLAVTNGKLIDSAASQGASSASGGTDAITALTTRGSGKLVIICQFNGAPGSYYSIGIVNSFNLIIDGVLSAANTHNFIQRPSDGFISFLETTLVYQTALPAGLHTFLARTNNVVGIGGVTIVVAELSK